MKQIVWEPHFYEFDVENSKFNQVDEEKTEYEQSEEEEYTFNPLEDFPIKKVMNTPFGLCVADDAMNPYKQFKFWIGHTNFKITPPIAQKIENVDGVEVLRILTPYRFIFAPAALFNSPDVKVAISKAIVGNDGLTDKVISDKVKSLEQQLSQFEKWLIYVFPNGKIASAYLKPDGSNKEEYERHLMILKESVKLSNGILITNE